jgi:hypothetical protein
VCEASGGIAVVVSNRYRAAVADLNGGQPKVEAYCTPDGGPGADTVTHKLDIGNVGNLSGVQVDLNTLVPGRREHGRTMA